MNGFANVVLMMLLIVLTFVSRFSIRPDQCIVQTLVVVLAILLNPKMFVVCDDFFRVSMVRRRRA